MYISKIKIGSTIYDIKAATGGTNTTYSLSLNGSTNGDSTNGTSLGTVYAPTTAGTSGQILTSSGSGAPTWTNAPAAGVSSSDVLAAIYTELYGQTTKPSGATTVTNQNLLTTLSGYQTAISDLLTIREGAALGATALQSYTEQYTGTVTSVGAGTGLSTSITNNGNITTTGSLSVNLNDSTSLGTIGTTTDLHPVGVDSNGQLCVSVSGGGASTYGDVTYSHASLSSKSGAITIDGTIPLHIISCSGNITGITLSSNPPVGHSCHVILTATAARTVVIAHNSTARKCPKAANLSLSITANGYVEVDFLNINNVIYVRGI